MRIARKWISVYLPALAFLIICCLGVEDKISFAGEKEHNSCALRQFGQFSAWSEPVNLGLVNSAFNDLHPAISANGLSLYFSSDRLGGPGGVDIWVSQRASLTDAWGPPQVLVQTSTLNTMMPLQTSHSTDTGCTSTPIARHLVVLLTCTLPIARTPTMTLLGALQRTSAA